MISKSGDSSKSRTLAAWPTWVAVAALWILTFAGQYWVFALLFLAWASYDILSGESRFIQRITRRDQPVTYLLVVLTWILLSLLWLLYPE